MLSLPGAVIERAMPRFAEVDLASASPGASLQPAPIGETAPPTPPARTGGIIEIMLLPSGVSLRVDAEVDGRALRRVLGALEGR